MNVSRKRPAIGAMLYLAFAFAMGSYFTFAAVQGDYGVFRRMQISSEKQVLSEDRDRLRAEVAKMQNQTRRLSDEYLDLDLLDERARDVLGFVRSDEIVIR